jgi:tetratricopeptide (TPR) repeat protein
MTNTLKNDLVKGLRASSQALASRQLEAAKEPLKSLFKRYPGHPEILHQMGLIAQAEGRTQMALGFLQQAAQNVPNNPIFCYNLGNVLLESGQLDAAFQAFEQALVNNPNMLEAANLRGVALARQHRFLDAKEAFETACKKFPKSTEPLLNLALSLIEVGEIEAAIAQLNHLVDIDPKHVRAHFHLGHGQLFLGRLEAAQEAYRKTIELDPKNAPSYRLIAVSKRYDDRNDPDFDAVGKLLEREDLSQLDRIHLHFALAKMLDDVADYEQAATHASKGNALHHEIRPMDRTAHVQFIDTQINRYDRQFFENAVSDFDDQRPLFIVGMPRSGTTLLEQMLACHPEVGSAGELRWMQRFARQWVEAPPGADRLAAAREDYLSLLGHRQEPNTRFWIDKMPSNFIHLGLIASLFPQSRVIHIRRDPLDICRSNFFTFFADGNFYSNDLNDMALYYLQYQRIMEHWRQVQPLRLLEIDYETLVNNTEHTLRQVTDFLDLPWHAGCLHPQKSRQAVRTASGAQVREPVNNRAIGRAGVYQKLFSPLAQALGLSNASVSAGEMESNPRIGEQTGEAGSRNLSAPDRNQKPDPD